MRARVNRDLFETRSPGGTKIVYIRLQLRSSTMPPLSADIVLRLVVPHTRGELFTRARFAANMAGKYPIYDFPERT